MSETKFVLVSKGSTTGPTLWVVMTEEAYWENPEGAINESSYNRYDLEEIADMKNEEEQVLWEEMLDDFYDHEEY